MFWNGLSYICSGFGWANQNRSAAILKTLTQVLVMFQYSHLHSTLFGRVGLIHLRLSGIHCHSSEPLCDSCLFRLCIPMILLDRFPPPHSTSLFIMSDK